MRDGTFLQNIPIFCNVSDITLEEVTQHVKRSLYKKGDIILNTALSKNAFLWVMQGWAKLFKESSKGEEIIIDILTENNYCGEQFIFQSEEMDVYTVQAISDIELFTLPVPLLQKLVSVDHQLALNFLRNTLEKEKELNMEIEHLSIQNASQRIGCFILRLQALNKDHTDWLHLPYDKSLLATRLGMRAETFSRALAKLSKQCDLEIKNESIHMNSVDKLVHYVCEHCSRVSPYKDILQ
ncbi:MAG TPA: Crp/Fnr family transcriptional regulator [Coxiellaceae bacterium]|nr:Crp/Fnr family transcriptional regulator [Coxiellaceae bacterium]